MSTWAIIVVGIMFALISLAIIFLSFAYRDLAEAMTSQVWSLSNYLDRLVALECRPDTTALLTLIEDLTQRLDQREALCNTNYSQFLRHLNEEHQQRIPERVTDVERHMAALGKRLEMVLLQCIGRGAKSDRVDAQLSHRLSHVVKVITGPDERLEELAGLVSRIDARVSELSDAFGELPVVGPEGTAQ